MEEKIYVVKDETKPWEEVKAIEAIVCPEGTNVRVDYVNKRSSWNSRFGGIQLSVNVHRGSGRWFKYPAIQRRILVKNNTIDLEMVKSKIEELAEIKQKDDEQKQKSWEVYQAKEARTKTLKDKIQLGINDSLDGSKYTETYNLKIGELSEEQVIELMEIVNKMRIAKETVDDYKKLEVKQ